MNSVIALNFLAFIFIWFVFVFVFYNDLSFFSASGDVWELSSTWCVEGALVKKMSLLRALIRI